MDLKTFVDGLNPEQRREFCGLAGTSPAYLSQLVNGHRQASTKLSKELVRASRRMFPGESDSWLTLGGVRPDIWGAAA